jgi:hypothetical protein
VSRQRARPGRGPGNWPWYAITTWSVLLLILVGSGAWPAAVVVAIVLTTMSWLYHHARQSLDRAQHTVLVAARSVASAASSGPDAVLGQIPDLSWAALERRWNVGKWSTVDRRHEEPTSLLVLRDVVVGQYPDDATPDVLAADAHLRQPVWEQTVDQLRTQRAETVSTAASVAFRLDELLTLAIGMTWQQRHEHGVSIERTRELDREFAAVRELMPTILTVSGGRLRERLTAWARVPREEVIDLPRGTSAGCDCRFGHYDFHEIVSHDKAGVLRECALCQPPTRWRETGAAT